MKRHGFTLIEMMIAVGLTAVVMGELVVSMMGLYRMEKNKMWNAEFADRLRTARENILFRALPRNGDRIYAGLLSATNVAHEGSQVAGFFEHAEKDTSVEFDANAENLHQRFDVVGVDDGSQIVSEGIEITNRLVFISVKASIANPEGGVSNRIERIGVPLIGNQRPYDDQYGPWDPFIDMRQGSIGWKQ